MEEADGRDYKRIPCADARRADDVERGEKLTWRH
jgi:hypothetical protein